MGTERIEGNWRQSKLMRLLEATAAIAFISVCGTVSWAIVSGHGLQSQEKSVANRPTPRPAPPPPLPSEPISLDGAILRGSDRARVVVIEFSEFQCPYCGSFARETLAQVKESYVDSGKVLLAFRHFPLEGIHSFALKAAEASECARDQGQFWAMHDLLFQNQKALDDESLFANAAALDLDANRFRACLSKPAIDKIRTDQAAAKTLGVTGTPTFFVGTVQSDRRVKLQQRFSGAMRIEQFRTILDKAVADSGSSH